MKPTERESELFRVLCAEIIEDVNSRTSDTAYLVKYPRALVESRTTRGGFLSVRVAIDDKPTWGSEPIGEWWTWTPTL